MALIFLDSFDYYATGDLTRKYLSSTVASISVGNGRRGTNAVSVASALDLSVPNNVEYYVGMAVRNPSAAAGVLWAFMNGNTTHVQLRVNEAGQLYVTLSTGTTEIGARSAVGAFPHLGYHYVECRMNIHDTTGSFEVRVDEVTVLTESNRDTRNGTPTDINEIRLGFLSQGHFDDFYVLDSSGGAPRNTFLGDVQVDAIHPDGAGNYSQFDTTNGSANHWENVDETDTDDDTTYNETPTAADRDSFTYEALPVLTGGDTVYGVQVNTIMRKTESGTQSGMAFLRISGTDYDGADIALGEAYTNYIEMFETNPNGGGEWTTAIIDGMEAGVEAV